MWAQSSAHGGGGLAELFIAGKPADSHGRARLEVINPATSEVLDDVPRGGPDEVAAAVDAAHRAFPSWSSLPAAARGDTVGAAARRIDEHSDELARLLTHEQGKPLREARVEIKRCADTLRHSAGLARNLRGGLVPDLDDGAYGMILKRPIGVVAAVVPWNFPTTLLANKLGPALVAGNCVVAKPAETTPLSTLRIAELMSGAGLPDGVLNVVTGLGPEAGESLVAHPGVGKVAFTGSTATGRRIMTLAADGVKRLTLELGGSDPMIVCDDADLDPAVSAASVGRFFNCGQACLAVKRLYLFDSIADHFLDRLLAKVGRLKLGPGTAEGVLLGPLHTERGRNVISEQVEDAIASGAKLLCGGRRPEGELFAKGFFYEPTVLLDPAAQARVATEEVFGPVLPVWTVGDLDEAIDLANRSPFGLGSSIWTRDLERSSRAARELVAGYTWVNSPQKIYDELPFGGLKRSGFGKEHGIEALDGYMDSKSVVVKSPSPRRDRESHA